MCLLRWSLILMWLNVFVQVMAYVIMGVIFIFVVFYYLIARAAS